MPVALLLTLAGLAILLTACSDDSQDSPSASTSSSSSSSNNTAFCKQLDQTEQALKDVGDAASSLDLAKLEDSLAVARAQIDALATTSERSGGGSNQDVEQLVKDIGALKQTLATPNLLPAIPTIKSQVATINNDISKAKKSNNC